MTATMKVTNLQNESSATPNIVLNADGTTTIPTQSTTNLTLSGTLNVGGGNLSPQTGFKNRIINGAMTIDQRNAGASVSVSGSSVYSVDRFAITNITDGTFTAQQDSVVPDGFSKSIKITIGTADTSLTTTQRLTLDQTIEGLNVFDLGWGAAAAQSVTLSFWVRSSLTGTFGGAVTNSARDRSYPFTYTISAANTWEQKTITIAGDTTGTWLKDNGIGLRLIFSMGVGPTYQGTAGAWAAADYRSATGAVSVVGTSGATFYITGVQLEKGLTATPFDFRSIGQELMLCQRYAYVTDGSVSVTGPVTVANSQTAQRFVFPVPLRVAPTVSINTSGTYFVSDDRIADYSATTFTLITALTNKVSARVDIGGFTSLPAVGTMLCGIPAYGTGRLLFSSEL